MSVIKGGWSIIGSIWAVISLMLPFFIGIYAVIFAILAALTVKFGIGVLFGGMAIVATLWTVALIILGTLTAGLIFIGDMTLNFITNFFKSGLKGAVAGLIGDASSAWSNFKAGARKALLKAKSGWTWLRNKIGF